MVYGSFWARRDPVLDGDGMRGRFRLDGEESDEGNYVFGSIYPVYLTDGVRFNRVRDRETADLILRANEPLAAYPKFEARIEDCVVLGQSLKTSNVKVAGLVELIILERTILDVCINLVIHMDY